MDDDPDDHYFFSTALNKIKPSATLQSFYTCNTVLKHLKDENNIPPDIIFLDRNITGNTHNECLKEIKATERISHVTVIVYTTGGNPKASGDAIQLRAYDYV